MQEHLSSESLKRYRQQVMSPEELLRADDHLTRCDDCYTRAAETIPPHAILTALTAELSGSEIDEADHLSYEQLAAYVDGEVDDVGREIAEVHLEVCRQCTKELQGLRSLIEEPSPVNDTFVPVAELPTSEKGGLPWRWIFGWRPLKLAGATLVILIASTLLLVVWRQSNRPRQDFAIAHNPNLHSQSPGISTVTLTPGSTGTGQTTGSAAGSTEPVLTPQPTASSASPNIYVTLKDGGNQVTLDALGNVSGLGDLSVGERQAVRTALSNQHLPSSPLLEGLRGKSGTLMGGGEDGIPFFLTEPIGKVLRIERPHFRWQPLAGANSYIINVYDQSYNKVTTSPHLTSTDWEAPALKRGVIYSWQVTAIKDGQEIRSPVRPAPEARFAVLDQQLADELIRVEKVHARSHLLLGTLYARAGLLDDAEREFSSLLRANPDSQVVRGLLREVRASRSKF